jgi:prepilin peptidase CpaA
VVSLRKTSKRGGLLCLSIKIDWVGVWIGFVALIAIVSDLRYRKIFNWLTLPAMGVGLFVSYFLGGLSGLAFGFTGVLLIFIAFGWMWGVKILGAGDVKLLMAFASLAGASTVSGRNAVAFVADLALLTILVGGFIAVILLGIKGRLGAFGKKLYRFLFTMASRNLATEFPKADPSLKMPFGVSISIAAIWLWFDNPLVRWGVAPW